MELVLFLQSAALVVTVHATQFDEMSPFQVPIRDVQVLPDIPNSFMKGIAATVGEPPQNIVLLPWPELNNTWIYDQAFCNRGCIDNSRCCQARRGNYYIESKSTTWVNTTNITVAGGASTETESQADTTISKLITSSFGGTDTFTLNTTSDLADFPVGVPTVKWDDGPIMLHAMGMGTNSTILNALFKAGRIGSRVWSIFWGRMWVDDDDAIDGSVVFGGYDEQKTIGRGYTQPLDFSEDSGCWTGMKVLISKIALQDMNANLLEPSVQLTACIVPQHQLLLNGPSSIISNFELTTGMKINNFSWGLHGGAYRYNTSALFDSDLTISLSIGLDIYIPSSQYLVPLVDIDNNGSRVVDKSQQELLIGVVHDSVTTLGRYFLTAAYLMVDLDANTFTLWQAKPTSDSKLVSRYGNTAILNAGESSRLSTGSLAGVVVGAVAGVAILGLGILFCFRRIHRPPRGSQTAMEPPNPTHEANQLSELPVLDTTKSSPTPKHELHGSPAAVSEMSGQTHHHTYEMDGGTLLLG
ncbi:acid protease [Annulohypoxylon maeteangense]|uniref:acid protease n=1 Tax=Annulohypoxylon maeteangense TaxID=1927788 RepID=UPI002008025A|nr:acid protease [Annulohypoxylon maeteangense]KAI0885840.1 acid protease [Annulohypoxylon maeteangense]